MSRLDQSRAKFQTTSWSLLEGLRRGDGDRRVALEQLAKSYWPPVYAYLRRTGRSRDDAADAAQAFFEEVALTRGLFDAARPERGRLRSLLLTALRRFLVDLHRRDHRPGASGARAVPLDCVEHEERIVGEMAALSPEAALEKRWALGVLDEAIDRCRRHFEANGRAEHWALFSARVLAPAANPNGAEALATLAPRCGFDLPRDGAAAVQTVKKRLTALLREVIDEHADTDADREADFNAVIALLG